MSNDNELFVKSLHEATLKLIEETEQRMKKACLVVERDAKINCPVDQGTLRASITHDVESNSQEIVGSVFSNLNYAPYVEYGTGIYAKDGNGRKTPWNWGNEGSNKWPGRRGWQGSQAQPFLEPAIEDNKEKIVNILGGKTNA